MALHLNLIHEIEQAERARQRDPLKLSLWGLGIIGACFASFYFLQLAKLSVIALEYSRKKAAFDSIEPKARAAKAREDELNEKLRTSGNLVQRIEGRFYWAPVMEQLVTLVPKEVQITKLAGDVQGEGIKKCRLTIDGTSAGPDPRKVAEDLRAAISDSLALKYKNVKSSFRALEDGIEMVKLDGESRPTATFAINVELQSGDEASAAPTTRVKKK